MTTALELVLPMFGFGVVAVALGVGYVVRPQTVLGLALGLPETDDPGWFVAAARVVGAGLVLAGVGGVALSILLVSTA